LEEKMNIWAKILVASHVAIIAAGAAEARGPLRQPWLIYPSKAMDECREGTAPQSYAAKCADLLYAYSRELEACLPGQSGGPVIATQQIAVQQSSPDCAAVAAKTAAASVK
jgi:hypothetical protein